MHFQGNKRIFYSCGDLSKTIKTIRQARSDLAIIPEVIEGQEDYLIKNLKKIGYEDIKFGNGHKTKYSNLQIKICVASKYNFRIRKIRDFPFLNQLGGGGGVIHCIFPGFNLIGVHLATIGFLRKKQLEF